MTDERKKRRPPRPKPLDFRVKLTAADHAAVTTHIAEKGFVGPHAKQDWLRDQIAGMSPAPARRAARLDTSHQRLPIAGGQEALALLGRAGADLREMKRDLRRMLDWINRIDPVFIADEHRDRVRHELPVLMHELIWKLEEAEMSVTPSLVRAIEAVRKASSR